MAITRWAPFDLFTSFEREMQSMLDRFATRPWWFEGFTWRPVTDIYREDGEIVIRAELPGIDPEKDLSVDIEGNVLRIKGEKKIEKELKEERRYLHECHYGTFRRELPLPEGVEADEIVADYESGVLTVRIPFAEEEAEEPKRITVNVQTD